MFSTEASTHDRAASLRNPRRRQRTSSSDSLAVRQQEPKRRKRSALADGTLESPEAHANANGSLARDTGALLNGAVKRGSGAFEATLDPASGLAVRNKAAKREKRGTRSDDGVELAKTDTYLLTRDRNIPQALQDIIGSEPWHARLCSELGYAVAFTQSRAIIWRYAHTRTVSSHYLGPSVIKLADVVPFSGSKQDAYDLLPIGTLVHDAGAGDIALLAVLPGGKVQYFESIRAAAETDTSRPKAQLSGPLKGAINGFYSSEAATYITEAEPDGFVLATTLGRTVHLSVRDPQGRPNISSQYLKVPSKDKGSLFGSIKNALTFGGPSQDVVSLNTLPGHGRSHREVIVATAKGSVQLWNIARHGPKTFEQEWDLQGPVAEACRSVSEGFQQHDDATLHDLTLVPGEDLPQGETKVMALVSFSAGMSVKYFVLGLALRESGVEYDFVHPIRSFSGPNTTPDTASRTFKPRLLAPQPNHTAFVVFDTKILVISLTRLPDNPDAQLHSEAGDYADNYEECLFFNRGHAYQSVGCAVDVADHQSEKASCDVIVFGYGHVRLSAIAADPSETRSHRQRTGVRSHLEQVVFFGNTSNGLLDFKNDTIWEGISEEEVEKAAFQIVHSILDSTSPFVPSVSPSMDLQLGHRAQAMLDLNKFLRRWDIPMSSRWNLMWSAEKLSAARAIHAVYNASLSNRAPGQRVLLELAVEYINENEKTETNVDAGETDAVRHYFTRDVAKLGTLLYWAQNAIDYLYKHEDLHRVEEQAPLVSQANDIIVTGLDAALTFREANAESFGLGKDMFVELVYQGNYADMHKEPWTCTSKMVHHTGQMAELVVQTSQAMDNIFSEDNEAEYNEQLAFKLSEDAGNIINVNFRAFEERCRWLESRTGPDAQQRALAARNKYDQARQISLQLLNDTGLQKAACEIAERYHDMGALALVTNGIEKAAEGYMRGLSPDEQQQGQSMKDEVDELQDGYFDRYGDRWADAYYEQKILDAQAAYLHKSFPHRQQYLTQFLRKNKKVQPQLNKLSWMNEVCCEQRFDLAADDLISAEKNEQRLWAKQVQLSLAKLNTLAAIELKQVDGEAGSKDVKKLDQRMQISQKQEELYKYMTPVLMGAIDESAELDIAMQTFGTYVADKPTLQAILRHGMRALVQRHTLEIEPLIDTLSLISEGGDRIDDKTTADQRFYTALWLLHMSRLARMDSHRAMLTERCIWRRCILQDDWATLNRTEGKSDDEVMADTRSTAVYKTLVKGYESGLFDSHPPLDPRALHPAGETVADLRQSSRFDSSKDDYLQDLASDLAAEDAALEEVLNKGRLDARWQGLIEAVKADLRGEQDASGRLMAYKEAERQALEQALERERVPEAVQPDPAPVVESELPAAVGNGNSNGHEVVAQLDGTHEREPEVEIKTEDVETEVGKKQQTTPKKSKKKAEKPVKKTRTSKRKEAEAEKELQRDSERRDAEGDVQMAA